MKGYKIVKTFPKGRKDFEINPEILSEKPAHIYEGVKVKVFKSTKGYDINSGEVLYTAEIMEGIDKSKYTTVYEKDLKEME